MQPNLFWRKNALVILVSVVLLLGLAGWAKAGGEYSISWWTVDGGGGGQAMVPRTPWKCTNSSLAACACACGSALLPKSCFTDTTSPTFLPSIVPSVSGYELVTSALCDEDHSFGRIGFDLLAQPIDMRLQRMGGYIRIVPPYLG